MKTLKMMKRWMFISTLFLGMIFGISTVAWGQGRFPAKIIAAYSSRPVIQGKDNPYREGYVMKYYPFLPMRDTVIMQGEEVAVGAFFRRTDKDKYKEYVDVEGFGRSKKSDNDKGYFVVKVKPKQTSKYQIKVSNIHPESPSNWPHGGVRVVYVAKTEQERVKMQGHLDSLRRQGFDSGVWHRKVEDSN